LRHAYLVAARVLVFAHSGTLIATLVRSCVDAPPEQRALFDFLPEPDSLQA